jgi:hypothetical protein
MRIILHFGYRCQQVMHGVMHVFYIDDENNRATMTFIIHPFVNKYVFFFIKKVS